MIHLVSIVRHWEGRRQNEGYPRDGLNGSSKRARSHQRPGPFRAVPFLECGVSRVVPRGRRWTASSMPARVPLRTPSPLHRAWQRWPLMGLLDVLVYG